MQEKKRTCDIFEPFREIGEAICGSQEQIRTRFNSYHGARLESDRKTSLARLDGIPDDHRNRAKTPLVQSKEPQHPTRQKLMKDSRRGSERSLQSICGKTLA